MALIHGLIAALARSAGKVLNTIFGWATALLFGRVTDKKQIAMSVACFGSLLWIVALIGMLFPNFAAFAIAAFVPQHDRYDTLIRWAMVAAAMLIPFVVGFAKMAVNGHRQAGTKEETKLRQVLDGWPYTIGLATTLLLMCVFAPIMKAQMFMRRWRAEHIPVMVEPQDYLPAVSDVETVLERNGFRVQRRPAQWMLRFPTQVLSFFAARQVKDMVADQLTVLKGKDFEVELHPSDLIVSGREKICAQVRAAIAEHLLFSHCLMTWNDEANKIEKHMKEMWARAHDDTTDMNTLYRELEQVDREVKRTTLRYEEWEVLFRQRLQLEQYMLRKMLGIGGAQKRRAA
jgi:hypothetical protein